MTVIRTCISEMGGVQHRILAKIAPLGYAGRGHLIKPQRPSQEGIITEVYWLLKSLILIHTFPSPPHCASVWQQTASARFF